MAAHVRLRLPAHILRCVKHICFWGYTRLSQGNMCCADPLRRQPKAHMGGR